MNRRPVEGLALDVKHARLVVIDPDRCLSHDDPCCTSNAISVSPTGTPLASPMVMEPLSIKRIVVGTDFSEGSDAAMTQAFSLAVTLRAVVDLVHVVEPGILVAPDSLGAMALADGPALFEEIDRALSSRAAQAQTAGLVCQTNSLQGFPSGELVRHAKKTGADLIVVGTHGRTGIAHVVLGSTAERVVQHAYCPVLVIPELRSAN